MDGWDGICLPSSDKSNDRDPQGKWIIKIKRLHLHKMHDKYTNQKEGTSNSWTQSADI